MLIMPYSSWSEIYIVDKLVNVELIKPYAHMFRLIYNVLVKANRLESFQ